MYTEFRDYADVIRCMSEYKHKGYTHFEVSKVKYGWGIKVSKREESSCNK